jgi:hypothetical protein
MCQTIESDGGWKTIENLIEINFEFYREFLALISDTGDCFISILPCFCDYLSRENQENIVGKNLLLPQFVVLCFKGFR